MTKTTKTKNPVIKINKHLAELLVFLSWQNLDHEYENIDDGNSNYTKVDLDKMKKILHRFDNLPDGTSLVVYLE